MEAVRTQEGGDADVIGAEGLAGLAFDAVEEAFLPEGLLECVEHLANAMDDGTVAAEIEGGLPPLLAIGEAIVGAEGAAIAAAPRCDDRPLLCKEGGLGGNEEDGRMFGLVNRDWSFHFGI